jgi:hypothetical protein
LDQIGALKVCFNAHLYPKTVSHFSGCALKQEIDMSEPQATSHLSMRVISLCSIASGIFCITIPRLYR